MGAMQAIERFFNDYFANWEICLPASELTVGDRGQIVKRGWTIWILYDSDEKGEYLDFYASHRMTNDRHVRIRSDGSHESLETISEFYVTPKDPAEAEAAKREFYERNRGVDKMLREKGFGMTGKEHGSARVNRWLLTTPEEER